MNDRSNWVGLVTHFDYETALQGYIAAYPHRLEDGLLPHPDKKIREKVFKDGTRSDVILIDRDERPVIVEAKRGEPSRADVSQLRNYMQSLSQEPGRKPRGILIHGGALKLSSAIRQEARKEPRVEIVRYTLDVKFSLCG
jgi:RecB family endonuclease NucS